VRISIILRENFDHLQGLDEIEDGANVSEEKLGSCHILLEELYGDDHPKENNILRSKLQKIYGKDLKQQLDKIVNPPSKTEAAGVGSSV